MRGARNIGLVAVIGAGLYGAACNDATGSDASVEEQRAYIDAIVPHHQMALMRGDEALAKATHQGLKNIAQRTKEDQAREIARVKEIR